MALTSGFYNAFLVNGDYDRKYNAEDYSDNMGAIIKTGVLRDGNNGLRVTANGLVLSVAPGRAWIEGHWVKLDTAHTFAAISPPVGDYSRIDSVCLRIDPNESARKASLLVRTGTPASSPAAPAPVRADGVYEIVLARVRVAPGASSVTVTDMRANASVCGWVTTPVGYDDYFTAMDAAFEEWFSEKRNTLSSVTLFKQYSWRTVLSTATNKVTFSIPQYDSSGVDIIQVFVNGLFEVEGVDYTLSGSTITFGTGGGGTGSKVAGTEIVVICYKSIDGTGLASVADRMTAMENTVATLAAENEYIYICNGVNDNVMLSRLAQAWLNGGTDYGSKIVRVYGTFGASAPNSGSGTSASNYRWFDVGSGGATNRKITFDFTGCSQITINCTADTHNIIFFGLHVNIIGANVVATGGAAVYMFSVAAQVVINAEKCRFWITSLAGIISRGGTFKDCRVSLTTNNTDAFAFNVMSGGLLRLFGGEYYAYAPSNNQSAVVYVNSAQTGAVVLTYGINCPNAARSSYVQTNAINCLTQDASCSFTDTITTLPIVAMGQNIRGTIAQDKPNMM
jgi:hypothetical protein